MDNIDSIDDRHPSAKVYADSIGQHSALAPFYKYRAPYLPAFFAGISEKLRLSPASTLLDVCCGRGELSAGFVKYCGRIFAVDGSSDMLAHAMTHDNIDYALHDVNQSTFKTPCQVDHFVIGSAIHWVKAASLQEMIKANLKPGGSVVISHPLLSLQNQPYKMALDGVLSSYGRVESAVDLFGVETLGKSGFSVYDRYRITAEVQFDLNYLLLNKMSLAYGDFYQNVRNDPEKFRKDLASAMAPFLENGKLAGTIVNWGHLFRRQP